MYYLTELAVMTHAMKYSFTQIYLALCHVILYLFICILVQKLELN